jgi:hypothetical protein
MVISKEESLKSAQILEKYWLFFLGKNLPNVAIVWKFFLKFLLTMLLGTFFFKNKNKIKRSKMVNFRHK